MYKKTIIIRLAGGLGNQIFQLGAGLYIAKKLTIKTIVIDDNALDSYDVKRKNELCRFFYLKSNEATVFRITSFLVKLRLPIHMPLKFTFWPFVGDKNFHIALNAKSGSFRLLDGYFQSCLDQNDFNNIVNILSTIQIKMVTKNIDSSVCVVHIRGNDFIKLGWDKLAPSSYYKNSINIMKNKYSVKKFIIVTDDPKYAGSIVNLNDNKFIVQSKSVYDDFFTISSYSKRILSTSTYALWASALGINDENGAVIAPKYLSPNVKRSFLLPNEIINEINL